MGTGAATPTWRELLLLAVRALEVGAWSPPLTLPPSDPSDTSEESTYLSVLVRITAGGLADQAAGDVAGAERLYRQAVHFLPDRFVRTDRDGRCLAFMLSEQRIGLDPEPLLCRVATVIGREQSFLDSLRRQLLRCSSPRDFLVEAAIQFQGEVECSPFSWLSTAGAGHSAPDVTPTRKDLLRRASNLRTWARPRAGDVSESVWKDIGGHRGLWAAAMTRLADRTPAHQASGQRSDVPQRRGHREAAERALRWKENLTY